MRYTAEEGAQDGYKTVRLADNESGLAARIAPGAGNNAFSLALAGEEFLWRPDGPLNELVERRLLFGMPFLSPWANRLDDNAYWVDGTQYHLNLGLGNIRFDHSHQPIHGLLLFEHWRVHKVHADDDGAEMISTFDFAAHPKLMAQFPFAHRLEMRHSLRKGRLYVGTRLVNECTEPLPVSFGFHPYFRLPGGDRNDWKLEICAQKHYKLNDRRIPTGETSARKPGSVRVKDVELDDVYSDLVHDDEGYARFLLSSEAACLHVGFGRRYPVAVVFAPPTGNFVCIEPMCAITNALNLSHHGICECPQVSACGSWEEEFWIEPVAAS
jgi:aldose 1-epimerase